MQKREQVKRLRVIVVGGRRGLCGAYNSNINRAVDALLKEKQGAVEVESLILGRKPADYYRRRKYAYAHAEEDLSDNATDWPLREIYDETEAAFLAGQVDEVCLLYTRFRSALSVAVQVEQFLPVAADFLGGAPAVDAARGITLYEPGPEPVFQALIPKYLRAKLLIACLNSKASEQGSRMTAMDAATENAGELIDALTLTHNKLRQASITADILDIIGGSENVEK